MTVDRKLALTLALIATGIATLFALAWSGWPESKIVPIGFGMSWLTVAVLSLRLWEKRKGDD